MKDVKCPYCGKEQEIDHDDGYGYEENETYTQECVCGKIFTFATYISFDYSVHKAPCLNGKSHKYKKIVRAPRVINGMEAHICEWCGKEINVVSECSKLCKKNKRQECIDCDIS